MTSNNLSSSFTLFLWNRLGVTRVSGRWKIIINGCLANFDGTAAVVVHTHISVDKLIVTVERQCQRHSHSLRSFVHALSHQHTHAGTKRSYELKPQAANVVCTSYSLVRYTSGIVFRASLFVCLRCVCCCCQTRRSNLLHFVQSVARSVCFAVCLLIILQIEFICSLFSIEILMCKYFLFFDYEWWHKFIPFAFAWINQNREEIKKTTIE